MTDHRPGVDWAQDPLSRKGKVWRLTCEPHGYIGAWVSQREGPLAAAVRQTERWEEHLEMKEPSRPPSREGSKPPTD